MICKTDHRTPQQEKRPSNQHVPCQLLLIKLWTWLWRDWVIGVAISTLDLQALWWNVADLIPAAFAWSVCRRDLPLMANWSYWVGRRWHWGKIEGRKGGARGFCTVFGAGWNLPLLCTNRQGPQKPIHSSGTLTSLVTSVSRERSQLSVGRRTHDAEESSLSCSVCGFEGKVGSSGYLLISFGASVRDKREQPTLVTVTETRAICTL